MDVALSRLESHQDPDLIAELRQLTRSPETLMAMLFGESTVSVSHPGRHLF